MKFFIRRTKMSPTDKFLALENYIMGHLNRKDARKSKYITYIIILPRNPKLIFSFFSFLCFFIDQYFSLVDRVALIPCPICAYVLEYPLSYFNRHRGKKNGAVEFPSIRPCRKPLKILVNYYLTETFKGIARN